MTVNAELEALERKAYRASYSDGIIDLYAGLSAVWIGVAWLWISDLAGLAGILPAIFVAPMLSWRKRFVERRVGYVQWRAPRRHWERRNLLAVLGAGLILFLAGVALFLFVTAQPDGSDRPLALAPGILAWLLALMAVVLSVLMDARRMLFYAAALAATGALTVLAQANPGWPLLLSGLVITGSGLVLLRRFMQRNPVVEDA